MARRYAQSLDRKGYLRRQYQERATNRFDLTGLFQALARTPYQGGEDETVPREGKAKRNQLKRTGPTSARPESRGAAAVSKTTGLFFRIGFGIETGIALPTCDQPLFRNGAAPFQKVRRERSFSGCTQGTFHRFSTLAGMWPQGTGHRRRTRAFLIRKAPERSGKKGSILLHAKIRRRPLGFGTGSPNSFAVSIQRLIAACALAARPPAWGHERSSRAVLALRR